MTEIRKQSRIFLGISAFMAVIAIVYWFASYEPAGTIMLALSSSLAAVCGVYLQVQSEHESAESVEEEHYRPHSSAWPFGIALGAALAVNGLIVGLGYAIPGLVVIAASLTGFIGQSRHRT